MITTQRVKSAVRQALRRAGYNLYRLTEEERQVLLDYERQLQTQSLTTVFGSDLPRLQELRRRYAAVELPVAIHSVWGARESPDTAREIGWGGVDLRSFRGHSAYVWDYAGSNFEATRLKYYLFADTVRRKDTLQLLTKLREDGAFGCISFDFPGIGRVSRDLLDSVAEINFLNKHLNILKREDLDILDVGAGYGRMAHRMLEAHPKVRSYTCVDAVPESTFLCEFYLKHRGLDARARVVPLDELEAKLPAVKYQLALNIHSFSECTYAAIEWWLRKLRELEVRHLMIVPNDPVQFLSMEPDRQRRDYAPLLKELGYALVAQEPVFEDPTVQGLIGVRDNMYLFECK